MNELFDYVEVFYNQRRRHSKLDRVSPAELFSRRGLYVQRSEMRWVWGPCTRYADPSST
jgi:hypothetical protein